MGRKVISLILIIILLQSFCGFVFAENIIANEVQTNTQANEQTNEQSTNSTTENTVVDKDLEDKKKDVEEKIDKTNTKLEYVQGELSTTMLRVQELEDKVMEYQSQMNELSSKLDVLEKSISVERQKLTALETDYNEREELLRQRMVTMYEAGETRYLDVLLSSKNIVEFISGYFLISEMVEYDNNLMKEVEEKKDIVEITKKKLEREETQIKIVKAKREQTTTILQNTIVMQQQEVAKLNKEEKKLKEEISTYKTEQAKIETAIRNAALANMNNSQAINIQYTGGDMLWPVAVSGTVITSYFGNREHPIQGVVKQHSGIDIGNTDYGAPIVAAADGVVSYAGWLGGYGNCVMINHGNGLTTLYGHGQKIRTELHKEVKQGELIMEVGSTGNSTGPHCHFEVRVNGNCVQPLNYVKIP